MNNIMNPLSLFYDHYAEATKNYSQKKSIEKFKSEIIKAWNNADREVRIKYNELASLLFNAMQINNLGMNFAMKVYFKPEIEIFFDKRINTSKTLLNLPKKQKVYLILCEVISDTKSVFIKLLIQ
ncbi:hypothetical protein GLOIN_2v1873665 [Rhizophagus irregularis DAOM 181602=DAOM 197198]|nr:hypothetical protein GLOIN_2v1873665 [Rhizophagus irregularis DAOM 181602=DAOM 197198]